MIKIQNRLLELITGLVFNHSWAIIIGFTLLAIVGFFYTTANLGVNSDTSEMFDEDLAFRQLRDQYKQAFPDTEDNIVVVVSGEVPELVASVADSLAENFKKREDLFESVFQPTGESFLKQHQLLFLDTTTLAGLSQKLRRAKPMISFLNVF